MGFGAVDGGRPAVVEREAGEAAEGIGAALSGRAQLLIGGVGGVGVVQRVQDGEQRLGVELVQHAVELAEPIEAGDQVEMAAGVLAVGVQRAGVRAVGVGVVGDPCDGDADMAGRGVTSELDEDRLVLADCSGAGGHAGLRDSGDVRLRHVAGGERSGELGQRAQATGGVHPPRRLTGVEAGAFPVPGCEGDRGVGAAGAAAVGLGEQPGAGGGEGVLGGLGGRDRVKQPPVVAPGCIRDGKCLDGGLHPLDRSGELAARPRFRPGVVAGHGFGGQRLRVRHLNEHVCDGSTRVRTPSSP